MTSIASTGWTGRPPEAGSPIDALARGVRHLLSPAFDCQWCIGQERHHGCYCAAMGAVAPGVPAGRLVRAARLFVAWLITRRP